MKWYYILLIVLAGIAVGMIVSSMLKSKSKASPPVKSSRVITSNPDIKVESSNDVDVITKDNSDGTKTVAVARRTV